MRKTKIICTIGPAVDNDESVRSLIQAGMDAARFNFSHGSHEEHQARIDRVKRISHEMGVQIALILDTKGPEIRVTDFEDKMVMLEEGDEFTLFADATHIGNKAGVGITYPYLAEDIVVGTRILVDDGLVSMIVKEVKGADILCTVENPGKISNRKSINIPDVFIDQPYISEKDRSDIIFGIANDIDFIAASFMRSGDDAKKLRKLLDVNGGKEVGIIAKIENPSGLQNLEDIIKITDGVMVARGDMGVEIEFERLPAIQKDIIRKCYENGKIVVTATQMLESMTEHPRPTRAEVSDVANAVYDGTTCIMLSGETAAGKYPIKSVKAMSDIATYTETQINYAERFQKKHLKLSSDITNTIASASVEASFFLDAKAIICQTITGRTARIISFYRPAIPVIACCTDEKASRKLKLSYGVYPVLSQFETDGKKIRNMSIELSKQTGIVKEGDLAVIVTGSIAGNNTITDSMQIAHI